MLIILINYSVISTPHDVIYHTIQYGMHTSFLQCSYILLMLLLLLLLLLIALYINKAINNRHVGYIACNRLCCAVCRH